MAETAVELIQEGKDITTHLTDTEKFNLDKCEQIIGNGLNTFLHVGSALAHIRDNRLYRESHKTWDKYCKERWDIGKRYADQQISAFNTVTLLEEKMGGITPKNDKSDQEKIILPMNEAQAQKIAKLKNPDDQVAAWRIVLEQLNEGKKLTAALVNKVVKEVKGEVTKRRIDTAKKKVDATELVSGLFKKQYQVMLDILSEERNGGWRNTSKKEAVKWLKKLVQIAESED